jgi:hypothetical protein
MKLSLVVSQQLYFYKNGKPDDGLIVFGRNMSVFIGVTRKKTIMWNMMSLYTHARTHAHEHTHTYTHTKTHTARHIARYVTRKLPTSILQFATAVSKWFTPLSLLELCQVSYTCTCFIRIQTPMSKFMAYTKLNLKHNLMWLLTLSLSP